jgi:hypothetical protein
MSQREEPSPAYLQGLETASSPAAPASTNQSPGLPLAKVFFPPQGDQSGSGGVESVGS